MDRPAGTLVASVGAQRDVDYSAAISAAQFLGHLPGRRGARDPVETGPVPLLVVDEASTMPGPDLADLISQAVENGGGSMALLADAPATSG